MLSGAYAILGLRLVEGELVVKPGAFVGNRVLQLRKVLQDGADIAPERPTQPKNEWAGAQPHRSAVQT